MGFLEIYGICLLVVLTLVTLLWAISVPIKDASIIDMAWGPLFVAMVWVLLAVGGEPSFKSWLVSLLVTLWGLRLAYHLIGRNVGAGEDRRYQLWRQHGGPQWWLITYWRIYLLQGGIALIVATPIVAAFYAPDGFGVLGALGVLVWAAGFVWELLADIQLTRFRAEPGSRGRILDTGLWSLCRHPNYFGDALQWWGLGLLTLGASTWWSLIGPLAMTAVFLYISNDVLERGMRKRHADYERYIADTPSFFPRLRRG